MGGGDTPTILTGLATAVLVPRIVADLHPTETKTDARDAAVIADAARTQRAAVTALHDPRSRAYYDRQRACGKTHTQALLRLARQRINLRRRPPIMITS